MKITRLAAVLLLAAAGVAHAQNTFAIQGKGASSGKCIYSFDKSKDGFKVTSRYQARLTTPPPRTSNSDYSDNSNELNEVQQTYSYKLDANYAYMGGNVIDSTTQVNNGYSPNKQRTVMQMSMVQGGSQGPSTQFPLMGGFIVMPNYDASAIQALLYQATLNPTSDNLYFLIVPQPGKGKAPLSVRAKWTALQGTTGTLNGKPVTLHHFGFAFGKNIYNVYADETNTLMEVDISVLNINLIRTGFALDAPAPK